MSSSLSRRGLAAWAAGAALVDGALVAVPGAAASAAASSAATAASPAAAAGQPLGAGDRLEIHELIARYAWAYDCGDAGALADTFVPEGSLVAWGTEVARGREALMGFARDRFAERGDKDWQHLTDHHVLAGYDGQRCQAYSYYSMLEGSRTEPREFRVRSLGYYSSDCVRTPRGWRFRSRGIHRWNAQRLPW